MTEQSTAEKIRSGTSLPLPARQDRWDRMQAWSQQHSLAEIVDLEVEYQQSQSEAGHPAQLEPLSRERVRAIINGARPGSVARPRLPGLLSRERALTSRIKMWKGRKGHPRSDDLIALLSAELKDVKAEITAEKRRKR